MLSQYFVMHSVRFIRVLFLIHMCLLNLQTCICLLYPTHSTGGCKERSPVLSAQCVWRVDMFLIQRGGYLLIPSLSHPPWEDLRSVWEGEGGEKSLQLKGNKREGDKKLD